MIDLHRILCPVDFSDSSRRALDYGAAIAGWYDARLTVLSVFMTTTLVELPPRHLDGTARTRVLTDLRTFSARVPSQVLTQLVVTEGAEVHEVIAATAAEQQSDLLVLGRHGRSGFRRLMMGSVTERILRQPPCATLVVPPLAGEHDAAAPVHFGHIVCAVDFSPGSAAALRFALSLAQESDAELLVLHVLDVPPELLAHPAHPPIDVDAVRAEAEAERLRRLREMIPSDAKRFCTVETAVTEGAADHAILLACEARHADLVVMGVNRHGTLDRLVFGSTAARITRAAHCPVLLIPATEAGATLHVAAAAAAHERS
jgi:nucleotide-binding universal stress UspA family protein